MNTHLQKIGNFFTRLILSSSFHRLLSKNTALIKVKGTKSGINYIVPVNYAKIDNILLVTSLGERKWWRNLMLPAPVTLRINGKDVQGQAKATMFPPEVQKGLTQYFTQAPKFAPHMNVGMDENNIPCAEDIKKLAKSRVLIKVKLTKSKDE